MNEALTAVNDTQNTATTMDLASLFTRRLPQDLLSFGYDGHFAQALSIEGRVSARRFSFIGSGSRFSDPINGTLTIDPSRGGRFWSPTFCGVCGNEQRNIDNAYV